MNQSTISHTLRALDHPKDLDCALAVFATTDGGLVIECDRATYLRIIPENKRDIWPPWHDLHGDHRGWQIAAEHVDNRERVADWLVKRFRD